MESLLRGVIEHELDTLLDQILVTEVELSKRLSLLVKSKEDYLRGFVVGYLNSVLMFHLYTLLKREPEKGDITELYDRIVNGRSAEIEEKIMQVLSR